MGIDRRKKRIPRKSARILVVGAGGLGSPVLSCLARASVRVLGVADGDTVELSNLHRQVMHTSLGQGRPKTDSAEEYLRNSGFTGRIEKHAFRLDLENILGIVSSYDVIVDASDTFRSKFMINDACVLTGRPLVHAGIVGFEGQLMSVLPGETACVRCLFDTPPPPETVKTCREIGVLGPAVGMLGAIQAAEALKIIDGKKGLVADCVLLLDARRMQFRTVPVRRDENCPLCGSDPTITSISAGNYPALTQPGPEGAQTH
jgi:adenylyltransferase/sulfurtransferase